MFTSTHALIAELRHQDLLAQAARARLVSEATRTKPPSSRSAMFGSLGTLRSASPSGPSHLLASVGARLRRPASSPANV